MQRRRAGWLTAVVMCVVIGALVWISLPRERLLMQLSTPVMSTAEFRPRTGQFQDLVPYFWVSDHEVGYFANDAADAHRTFMVHDIVSGKTQRRFTASIQQIPWGEGGKLSPDGKSLLWMHLERFGKSAPIVYRLDGSQRISLPATYCSELTWTADSQALVSSAWYPRETALQVRHLPDGHIGNFVFPCKPFTMVVGFTAEGHVILAPDGVSFISTHFIAPNYPVMHVTEYALSAPLRPLHTFTITVPRDADYGSMTLSPQGDRLLWSLTARQTSPLLEWLRRLVPSYKPSIHSTIIWRVSRLDGSEMHEIGHAPVFGPNGSYGNPRWTPDGKRVSFIRKNVLYTVPVD